MADISAVLSEMGFNIKISVCVWNRRPHEVTQNKFVHKIYNLKGQKLIVCDCFQTWLITRLICRYTLTFFPNDDAYLDDIVAIKSNMSVISIMPVVYLEELHKHYTAKVILIIAHIGT